jgi:conjugal transfer pilus assembly protein TraA
MKSKLNKILLKQLFFICMICICKDSFAGTGGDEFADVWDTLKEWIQGTLGRVVCGSMILVGIVAGVARQSISAFAVGIGGGIGLYNTPTVIESVLSASISSFSTEQLLLLQTMLSN